jgi:hypothetical protein
MEAVLMEAGYLTVGHVLEGLKESEARLLGIKGFGPRSLETLKARLEHLGLLA